MAKAKHTAIDKFALVTEKIVKLLEQGKVPWRKPWHSSTGAYSNLVTGHAYQGINPLLCLIDCAINGWEHPFFISFNQAKELNWTVKKGAKATWIKWGGTVAKTIENDDGSTSQEFFQSFRWYSVFNLACIDDSMGDRKLGDLIKQRSGAKPETLSSSERIEAVEQFIVRQGARVRFGGSEACYVPSIDAIQLPVFEDFDAPGLFYATHIHELSHWTGHPSRLHRNLSERFGSANYAREELIAELSAAFVCNALQIEVETQHHASYLQHWLGLLKGDEKAFFQAASKAQKSAGYLLSNAGINPTEAVEEVAITA